MGKLSQRREDPESTANYLAALFTLSLYTSESKALIKNGEKATNNGILNGFHCTYISQLIIPSLIGANEASRKPIKMQIPIQ